MNTQVLDALKQSRYKVLTDSQDLEDIFRLRYKCYHSDKSIAANERRMMSDAFDETENCLHVAVEMNGRFLAAMRLHLVSELSPTSPTAEVFPEVLDDVKRGRTALDPTRFVTDPDSRNQRIPLHFLALRIPFLAAIFYKIDLALAPVRSEHVAFYRRYLGYEYALKPRSYPGLKKPVHLLTAKFREQCDAVLRRSPAFGPVDEIPQSNIAFPSLTAAYASCDSKRSNAA